MRRNRRITQSWSERHPVASDVLGGLTLAVMGYVLTVLTFCL
jgi:hypothetical protein